MAFSFFPPMLPNQTWVCSPTRSKANPLTLGCGEGKHRVFSKASNMGPSKKNGQLMLKRPKVPNGFQGSVFKDSVKGEGWRVPDQLMDFFLLVGSEVTRWYFGSQHHQPSGSNQSGVYVLVGSMQLISSTWWGLQYLQNSSGIWLRMLSIALEKELKVLDFVLWLSY